MTVARPSSAQPGGLPDAVSQPVAVAADAVAVVTPEGQLRALNPAFAALAGVDAERAVGRTIGATLDDRDAGELLAALRRLRARERGVDTVQLRFRRGHSPEAPLSAQLMPFQHNDGATWFVLQVTSGVGRRSDALNESEWTRVLQNEKMASLGQLAAGVAHEINNPLAYVSSNLGTLADYVSDLLGTLAGYEEQLAQCGAGRKAAARNAELDYIRADVVSLLSDTQEGVTRVKNIVQNLKDFSRAGAIDEWQYFDIHAGLESTLKIAHNEIKYKCSVEKDYGEIPLVYCAISQVNQVFLNVLVNAAQSIAQSGVIRISTGHEGEFVRIGIEDTGCGIAREHLERIFEPFFSTKAEGTGIGLSVAYQIIKAHRGLIEVQSTPGKGTAMFIWLPIDRNELARGLGKEASLQRSV